MEHSKKKRGENWTSEEKDILRQLISESAHILENKSTKTNANMLKCKEWKNVTNKLSELMGKNRTDAEIKLAWKRMKLAAKANLSFHNKELSRTGGGQKPPSLSPEDLAVMSIAPHDFVIEVNHYDSDAMITIPPESIAGPSSTTDSVTITDDVIESNNKEKQVNENLKKMSKSQKSTVNKSKTVSQKSILGHQAIIDSNVEFKKRQLEMLEVEHNYNIQTAQFKIKNLQLHNQLLVNQIRHFTEVAEISEIPDQINKM